ncbi:NAD-dependent epimerase/dehydratase family protein [Granulicella arctica]|uniref:Nucleoside-diphosphate-sugar epimerase n=1 Tax=Granulicella arctica TaxID=940613 RepID=A0A7Y9PH04_9BACT|nr:nucleoside-diphosphate-sugar epimerase [Granulicella arctica]
MTTLITGASGFLGGRLAQLLAAQGEQVIVLARPTSDLRHLAGLPIRIVPGDLTDLASLRAAVVGMGVAHIFHCAACSTDWAPWKTYFDANVTGTQNLLEAALESPTLARFVHVSTTDVYGYPAIPCDESAPTRDAGLPYNQTKRLGELAVWRAHQDHGLPVTIVRPATIYGPRGKDFTVEIATLLRQRLMATIDHGRAPGGFAYVDNVAEAMIAAAHHPATLGHAFNLSDGTHATWADYVKLFSQAIHAKPPWINLSFAAATNLASVLETPHRLLKLPGRPLLTRHAVQLLGINQEFPIAKAKETFGFAPKISLEEGIARSAAWLHDRA